MIVGEEFKLFIKNMGLKDDDFVAIDDGGLSLVVLNNELQEVGRYEVGGIPEEESTFDNED